MKTLLLTLLTSLLAIEQPILKIGCMSDIHNQNSMISADVSDIRLRQSFLTTLDSMRREGVDMLILGGDYTSDCTISEKQWMRVRELMITATRKAIVSPFKPVLFMGGNHDYEVANFDALPKTWLASDYYSLPMSSDIGALASSECYYETAANGASANQNVLAAYHYVIHGLDFLVMNPGKYFFASAWDYQVSSECVDWVEKKLKNIYASDSTKTVFFLHHLPLPGSTGVQSGKTLKDNTVTQRLQKVLAQYPNLIYLYGHDHSTKNSFILSDLRQRFTRYDTQGNLYTQPEPTQPVSKDSIRYPGVPLYIKNTMTPDPCLATGSSTSALVCGNKAETFLLSDDGAGNYALRANKTGAYVHCNGTFDMSSTPSALKLYRMTSIASAKPWVTGVQVKTPSDQLDLREKYIIVGTSSKDYVMSNENKTNSLGSSSSITYTNDSTFTYTSSTGWYNGPSATNGIVWSFVASTGDDSTPTTNPTSGTTAGCVSSFMGSMRYNSFDSNSSPGTSEPLVIQGLMVYVYADSVVLKMKNYGRTGLVSGSAISATIEKELQSITLPRSIKATKDTTAREEPLDTTFYTNKPFTIASKTSSLLMDANLLSLDTNTPVVTWEADTSRLTQYWRIRALANGYHLICNHTEQMAISDPRVLRNQLVLAETDSTDISQQWELFRTKEGYYMIINRASNNAMNNEGGGLSSGTAVTTYTLDRTSKSGNRLWIITQMERLPNAKTDGLNDIFTDEMDTPAVYTLSGQRVAQPAASGVYIIITQSNHRTYTRKVVF